MSSCSTFSLSQIARLLKWSMLVAPDCDLAKVLPCVSSMSSKSLCHSLGTPHESAEMGREISKRLSAGGDPAMR